MDDTLPPLTTWQFYHACQHVLGMPALQKIFKRSPTQIYRWARDPAYCEDIERNPLDLHLVLMERLSEIGRADIARAAASILAQAVGCELVAAPSKWGCRHVPTVEEQLLDVYMALTKFVEAVRQRKPAAQLRYLAGKVKEKIDVAIPSNQG